MNLEAKVDGLCEAMARIESKLDQIIEKQNAVPRPASLNRLKFKKTKEELWHEEVQREIDYFLQFEPPPLSLVKKHPQNLDH